MAGVVVTFLSDLCGREDKYVACYTSDFFLSDLCGREAKYLDPINFDNFLSDLCGREVKQPMTYTLKKFSKRPVRS